MAADVFIDTSGFYAWLAARDDRHNEAVACVREAAAFDRARAFFLRHADKSYSFTDCVSFCTMHSLGLRAALTKDAHFRQAGFVVLLDA